MRVINDKIVDDTAITSDTTYEEIKIENMYGYSVQFIWTSSSATATLLLQGSNDGVTWSDLAPTQAIASNNGSVLFNVVDVFYLHFRSKITVAAGTVDTLEATVNAKGF